MKRKVVMQVKALAEEFDLKIKHIEESKHYKVTFERKDGTTLKLPVAASTSDHRSHQNLRSQLRKISKGIPTT